MHSALQLDRMTRAEKLSAMEALWADLSQDEGTMPSPEWHGAALRETAERLARGEEQAHDWSMAREALRNRRSCAS